VGTWVSTSEKVNSSYEIAVEPYQNDGLSFVNAAQKSTRSLKFDGKDYLVQGPNLPQDYASSGRRLSERRLELTDKVGTRVIDTQRVEVSADGRTLTMSLQPAGTKKPNVMVFNRE
jgi:hypothetical protein